MLHKAINEEYKTKINYYIKEENSYLFILFFKECKMKIFRLNNTIISL